jgi:anhydro-N-acetylmuramic acid kinase
MAILTAVGLMSVASLEGVDAALIRTDGKSIIEQGPALRFPYRRDLKVQIRRAAKAALEGRDGAADIGKAAADVTAAHADAVEAILKEAGAPRSEVDVIGMHGHTILHRLSRSPESKGRTWQLGDGSLLAETAGIDVISGFRTADLAAGGDGAPLAPAYHCALARQLDRAGALGVLDLGVATSVTFVPASREEAELIAFDCGPGHALVDEWMELKTGEPMDPEGAFARAGKVHAEILRMALLHPFVRRKPPKSLDRTDFKLDHFLHLSAMDGAATLTAYVAACVRASEQHLPEGPEAWIACGAGRENSTLMEALTKALTAPMAPAEAAGWRGDHLEAESIAYLAVRSLKKLPLTFPKTTRVPRPMPGGVLHRAAR